MKLSQECTLLQGELKKFAQQVIADKVDELEKTCTLPLDNVKRLAEMGILGAIIPEKYGGAALDTIGFTVVLEELSKVCASTAFIIATHNAFFAYPLLKFANEELQKRYLPQAASGQIIGGYALPMTSELNIKKANGKPCFNGRNQFVLNAAAKGPFINHVPEPDSPQDSTFYIIDSNTTGCTFSKQSNTIGLKSAGIGEYVFENCCPATDNIVGEAKDGEKILQAVHDYSNVLLAAISLGIAQGATEAAIKYAKERVQFQQAIVNFGMVREMIADMSVKIEAARNLIYETALRMDRGEEYRSAGAMSKLFAGQSAAAITIAAIQIYGGYGYIKDYPAERYFRDAQMLNVICSTPSQEKERIAKEVI